MRTLAVTSTPQIGNIFYVPWGTDKNNVDFYQVTGVKGDSIEIRPIKQKKALKNERNPKPVRDKFIGKPIVRQMDPMGTIEIKDRQYGFLLPKHINILG